MNKEATRPILDPDEIQALLDDPKFPALVSFPRSGCHWLCMLMELYFERPLLEHVYYFHDNTNYLAIHTHDHYLMTKKESVIYLYRNPVDTIYSILRYYETPLTDKRVVIEMANKYIQHLRHWILNETFSLEKTIITYDKLQATFTSEFVKVIKHFEEFDVADKLKINDIHLIATKKELLRKEPGNRRVSNLSDEYRRSRIKFRDNYDSYIYDYILSREPKLKEWI